MDSPIREHNRIKITIKQVYHESGTKLMESEGIKVERID
jgi:hypothetical protein